MASNNLKMSKQGTVGKEETRNFNNSSGIWNNWGAWKWWKVKGSYGFIQQWIINYLWYKAMEHPITINYSINWKCNAPFQVTDLQGPKLAQLDKMLHKSFTVPHSKQKPMAEPMILGKAKYFYDEMKITDKCTFSGCWMQNFKEPAAEENLQSQYSSKWLCSPSTGAITKNFLWELRLIQVL